MSAPLLPHIPLCRNSTPATNGKWQLSYSGPLPSEAVTGVTTDLSSPRPQNRPSPHSQSPVGTQTSAIRAPSGPAPFPLCPRGWSPHALHVPEQAQKPTLPRSLPLRFYCSRCGAHISRGHRGMEGDDQDTRKYNLGGSSHSYFQNVIPPHFEMSPGGSEW